MNKQRINISKNGGFTLVELILAIVIVGLLATITVGSYRDSVEKTNIEIAKADIKVIEGLIENHFFAHNALPNNLNNIFTKVDPWGNNYEYLNMSTVTGNGPKRKDRNLVPVNSDYDLYSKGPDGQSASAFTAQISHDDIVRANNGGYIGQAIDY
jgi:general secretion pathway protein G